MKINRKIEPYLYTSPAMTMLILFLIVPIIIGIGTAFFYYKLTMPPIRFNGLDNFIAIFQDPAFYKALVNSFFWVVDSLLLQLFFGFMLAMLLNKPFRGRQVFQAIVLAPWAVSGFIIGILWKWLFNGQYGLINDILIRLSLTAEPISFLSNPSLALFATIVANVWYGIPFFAIMSLAALQSIPHDLYEAADIDGAGWFTKLFRITLPYIKPTLLVTILLRVIWIFNFADIIFIMTGGGPNNATEILATSVIFKAYTALDYGQASAMGVIFMLILLVYLAFYLHLTKFKDAGDF